MTHTCPGPGCTLQVPANRLACGAHWFQVTPPTRDRVWAAYKANDVAAHREAMADAITEMRQI